MDLDDDRDTAMLAAVKPTVRQQFGHQGTRKYPPLKKRGFNAAQRVPRPAYIIASFLPADRWNFGAETMLFFVGDLTQRFGHSSRRSCRWFTVSCENWSPRWKGRIPPLTEPGVTSLLKWSLVRGQLKIFEAVSHLGIVWYAPPLEEFSLCSGKDYGDMKIWRFF